MVESMGCWPLAPRSWHLPCSISDPRWASWVGTVSATVLATIFLQGMSEVTRDEALHYLAYHVMGQRLEWGGWSPQSLAWCVVVLVVDRQLKWRKLGILAMATVTCVQPCSMHLGYQGTSLDAEASILKTLWLMPFVWILFESTTGKRLRSDTVT